MNKTKFNDKLKVRSPYCKALTTIGNFLAQDAVYATQSHHLCKVFMILNLTPKLNVYYSCLYLAVSVNS